MGEFESDGLMECYTDRNLAVLALARLAVKSGYRAGVRERESDWPIITVDLPSGQVTWHVPRRDVPDDLPDYPAEWDGHNLREKQDRVRSFAHGSWEDAFRLCYVDKERDGATIAYFTTQPLAEAWGDDWDDAPYEHNAGTPYEWRPDTGIGCKCNGIGGFLAFNIGVKGGMCGEPNHKPVPGRPVWRIVRATIRGDFEVPADGHLNSPWSVKDINEGAAPWLRGGEENDCVMAGATLPEVRAFVTRLGGRFYAPDPPSPCLPS